MGRRYTRRVSSHHRRKYIRGGDKVKLLKRLFTPSRWFTRKNKIVVDNDNKLSPDDIILEDKYNLEIPSYDPHANSIDPMDSIYDLDNRNNFIPDERSYGEIKKEEHEVRAKAREEEWKNSGGRRHIRKTRKIKRRIRRNS